MRFKDIQRLVKILENSNVAEIEVTNFFGRKIRISRSANNAASVKVEHAGLSQEKTEVPIKEDVKSNENLVAIRSPIVGTFYRSPAPDAPPYVDIGDVVKPGQAVCIVEAMKLMNEIESDVTGKIVKILAKNEDPVEYNQELFMVEQT
ncbi:MAG: acetyl-CoA carboxylase biotin carboxyl carrier protein [bacterium]